MNAAGPGVCLKQVKESGSPVRMVLIDEDFQEHHPGPVLKACVPWLDESTGSPPAMVPGNDPIALVGNTSLREIRQLAQRSCTYQ